MRMTITALLALCLYSGCGLIMIGDPVEKQDLTLEDDAEENLKAIRAILADQAARSAHPDEHAPAPSSVPPATEPAAGLIDPPAGTRPIPSPSSSSGHAEIPAKLPWAPTAPERAAAPDRPVPAYTTPAPVGPDHSGAIRCAPDGLGGQRCVGR
ncbi:MAG TPA: hypothetical protein VLE25_08440 [Nitrospira sp.]|nr:hypothetical protein [Nitrospira sp.]